MKIINSIFGVPIRLTHERMDHIGRRHPEMTEEADRILETVNQPDFVQEGDAGAFIAIRHYPKTPLTEKFCAVVYKEISDYDGFVVTAYFTSKPALERKILWKL